MKYLLLLLAPVLLSISPLDHGEGKSLKLTVYNETACRVWVSGEICVDAACSGKEYIAQDYVPATDDVEWTWSSEKEGGYFCHVYLRPLDQSSFELSFNNCGSMYEAAWICRSNDHEDVVKARVTWQSEKEIVIQIYYYK